MAELDNPWAARRAPAATISENPWAARRTAQQPATPEQYPGGIIDALKGGTKLSLGALRNAFNIYTGDNEDVLSQSVASAGVQRTEAQEAFAREIQLGTEQQDAGFIDGLKNVFSAIWKEPQGALHEMVAQLPNTGVALGGMAAGAKVGGVIGGSVGSLPGAAVGSIVGGILGMFASNAALETGFLGQEAAQDGGFTDQERAAAMRQGAVKGGVITAVDTATLGLTRAILGAPGRAVERAVRTELAKAGIDVADDAAVKAAVRNKPLMKMVTDAGAVALSKTMTGASRLGRGGLAFSLETVGEGAGEYAGSVAAGLEASPTDAIMESIMASSLSLGELYVGKRLTSPGKTTRQIQEEIQRIASAPTLDDAMQAAIETVEFTEPGPPMGPPAPTVPDEDLRDVAARLEREAVDAEMEAAVAYEEGNFDAWVENLSVAKAKRDEARNAYGYEWPEGPLPMPEASEPSPGPQMPGVEFATKAQLDLRAQNERAFAEQERLQNATKERDYLLALQQQAEEDVRDAIGISALQDTSTTREVVEGIYRRKYQEKVRNPAMEIALRAAMERAGNQAADPNAAAQPSAPDAGGGQPAAAPTFRPTSLDVQEVPVNRLTLSKDVPQFKESADPETGVVEPLEGKYNRLGAGPILVWERKNGKLEVISGRHRLDLARRSGEKTIPAQVVREAEGFTKLDAQTADAELNIRDNQGEVKDYANYFRLRSISEAEAQQRGLLSRSKGRDGYAIGQQGTDLLFRYHQTGQLTDTEAAAIARAAPGNEALQTLGIQKRKAGATIDVAVGVMQAVQAMRAQSNTPASEQGDIFGFDDSAMQEAERIGAAAAARKAEIRNQISAVKGAAKRPEEAKKLGVNVKDPKALKAKIAELEALARRWDRWATDPELRAELMGEPQAAEPTAEPSAEPLVLEQPTESSLRALVEQRRREEEARRAEEARADADAQVNDFALAGSASDIDEAEARGQQNMEDQLEESDSEQEEAAEQEEEGAATPGQSQAIRDALPKKLQEDRKFTPVATGKSKQKRKDVKVDATLPMITQEQFKEIVDEWAALFENPDKTVNLDKAAKDSGEVLTLEQAQARVDEWRKAASEQNWALNSQKTILSLFDYTGNWVRPYAEAGYNVILFDIKSGQDVLDFSVEYFNENWDFSDVYGILAACPCTDFAVSGARWFEDKDLDGRTEVSKELVMQTLRTIEYFRPKFWVLENPVGRIERLTGLPKARASFQPNNFGDPYTKKTMLWGKFNTDLPLANVEPTEGSKMHSRYGGKSEATKTARSETPMGFAYSFFMANNYQGDTAFGRLSGDYPEIEGALQASLDAGLTEAHIREVLYETYENYEVEAAIEALSELTAKKLAGEEIPEPSDYFKRKVDFSAPATDDTDFDDSDYESMDDDMDAGDDADDFSDDHDLFSQETVTTGRKGMSAKELREGIADVVEKLKATFDVEVLDSEADMPTNLQGEQLDGFRRRGRYVGGRVYLFANNIDSIRQARVTLAHELVGHKGVLEMAGREGWAEIRDTIKRLRLARNPTAVRIWNEVNRRYKGKSEDVKYKEFIAVAAEQREKRGPVATLVAKIKEMIRAWLGVQGIRGPFSELELDAILSNAERYLASRTGIENVRWARGMEPLSDQEAEPTTPVMQFTMQGASEFDVPAEIKIYESGGKFYRQASFTTERLGMAEPRKFTKPFDTAAAALEDAKKEIRYRLRFAQDKKRTNYSSDGAREAKKILAWLDSASATVPQTDTPAFRRWFGDSKVVDASGNPMVVYHGTFVGDDGFGDIEAFDRMATVKIRGLRQRVDTVGSWFSTRADERGAGAYGSFVYPVYLSIRNPYKTTFAQMVRRAHQLAGTWEGYDESGRRPAPGRPGSYENASAMIGEKQVDALRKWLKATGRDGIHLVHDPRKGDGDEFKHQDAWIALEPEQIKSAIGNTGAFNPESPGIMYSRREDRQASNDPVDPVTRRFFLGTLAGLAAIPAVGAYQKYANDVALGRAEPVAHEALNAQLPESALSLLAAAENETVGDAGAIVRSALEAVAADADPAVRELARRVAALVPDQGLALLVDTKRSVNAHGAVEQRRGGAKLTLFTAGDRTGLTVSTFIHEALHAAVMARYSSLNVGMVTRNFERVGMSEPKAVEALAQFRKVWSEFRTAVNAGEGLAMSIKEAANSPDEFFVRALTDPALQEFMAQIEYDGRTLFERFKDWIVTNLLGVKKGVQASWLDAALTVSEDLLDQMMADNPNYTMEKAVYDQVSGAAAAGIIGAPRGGPLAGDPLTEFLTTLAQSDEVFQLPVSKKKNMTDIFNDLEPAGGFSMIEEKGRKNDKGEKIRLWRIMKPGQSQIEAEITVTQQGDEVWLNIDDSLPGQDGKRIYNAVANYAHNNGLVFIGDPDGLSSVAMSRRLENMLSSALKFGTTRHLAPHLRQRQGGFGVPPLMWKDGDDVFNIAQMARTAAGATLAQFPGLASVRYNSETERFEDATNGRTISDSDLDTRARRRRVEEETMDAADLGGGGGERIPVTAGSSSLKRAILTHAFLRGTGGERSRLLETARRIGVDGAVGGPFQGIFYSVAAPDTDADTIMARKLGLGTKAEPLVQTIKRLKNEGWRSVMDTVGTRLYEGVFDGLIGIKRAEDIAGKGVAAGDYQGAGYVGARLATGVADLMHAILHYGAPQWSGGVPIHKPDTKGLLEIFAGLGSDINDWLGWMAGNRAAELMSQGREQNLTGEDIRTLRALGDGKEEKFRAAKAAYNALNSGMLDFAQEAGLINPASRAEWESEWYVPFYRFSEADGEAALIGPRTTRGLSHQSAAIKRLRGSALPVNDLMENILTNWMKLADASMKNMALIKTVDNLRDSEFLTDESVRWQQVVVSKSEIAKRIKQDRKLMVAVANFLGMDGATLEEVAQELAKIDSKGFEQMWGPVAPTDPDIVRVQRNGKNEYFRVNDPSLLRSLTHLGSPGYNDPVTKGARWFKRLLTTGVTASPDFILRNFIRDAAHAWAINPDGFSFGKDSLLGLAGAIKEDEAYRELMFSGASFQGGYVHGTDPEASAQIIRRVLKQKGLDKRQIDAHMASLVDTPEKLKSALERAWQTYRSYGDKVENANRLATFKNARKSGKDLAQAVFEAKDLMDYSLRGNMAAMVWLTDVVPFLNARLQGLSKLARAGKESRAAVAMAIGKIAMFSVALAALNDDDDDYQELQDWEKDTYWHFFIGEHHFRIPKPFEIGILAGTIPERIYHAWLADNQPDEKVLYSFKHGLYETLGFNPLPQLLLPMIEVWGNRSFFFDTPIESFTDQQRLPEDRYNAYTSSSMVQLGQLFGVSPSKLQHLWEGYTGTMGAYALSAADILVRFAATGDVPRPEVQLSDLPAVKSFYRGDAPKRSTQYVTDFYDRMAEVNMIYSSIRERLQYDPEGARELMQENRDKLRYRDMLNRQSRRLSELRAVRERIMAAPDLSSREKFDRINQVNAQLNRVTEAVSALTEDAF